MLELITIIANEGLTFFLVLFILVVLRPRQFPEYFSIGIIEMAFEMLLDQAGQQSEWRLDLSQVAPIMKADIKYRYVASGWEADGTSSRGSLSEEKTLVLIGPNEREDSSYIHDNEDDQILQTISKVSVAVRE